MKMLSHRDDFLFPIENQFNKLFDQFFSDNKIKDSLKASQGYPKMDVVECENSLMVKVALPGLKAEDIDLNFDLSNQDEPKLTISGTGISKSNKAESLKPPNEVFYHVKDLRQSSFKRTLLFPKYVNTEPDATLEDGILTLTWKIPEKVKEPEVRKIAIKEIKK